MPDPTAVKLFIEKLVAGGDGLAFLEGKAVFVPFALPGETVLASITSVKRDFAQARLVDLLEPSRHRVEPPCPVYRECGGCNLQHLAYPRQVEEKALIVAEAFARTGRIETGEIAVVPSLPFAYRNRVQLHFTRERRLGFMKRYSSDLVEVPTCMVALRPIQDWIEDRAGTKRAFEELRPFVFDKDRFLVFGYGDEVWIEGKKGLVEVSISGQGIRFHIRNFFQSNLYLLDYFVPDAVTGLSGQRAADLYCGVGLFGRFLSSSFQSLVCVEQNPYALSLARTNVPGDGHEFFSLSVEDWVRSDSARKPFDLVLVDPPRTGLAPQVREWLIAAKPAVIVYLSCDPVTLARDSGELVMGGYELQSLKAFDFYPQTSHVECNARFVLR
ncbi:MAG: class I SAM-dependent RNA methyltransferase [Rectinemataceae bacterium]|jgi:23S rRNA (uracil1939-C5)-methyltransferase